MDWSELRKAQSLSVPDQLSIDLERLILDGRLSPGERLPNERELAESLGVSRASIRQALKELETRGMIERKPGRGTIVLSPGEKAEGFLSSIEIAIDTRAEDPSIAHIMELRQIIEPPIARLTASRANARDLAQLNNLVLSMESDVSNAQYAALDRSFHQAIAQYTHNPLLAFLNQQIATLIAPSRARILQTKERRRMSSAAHRRIYDAIANGQEDLAEKEALDHVVTIRAEIMAKAFPENLRTK